MQYLKNEIRTSILDAARQLFLEKGYGDTSMREIADSVGIVSGNLYRYYDGKEAIFESVVQEVADRIAEIAKKDYLADIDNESLDRDDIKKAVMQYLSFFDGNFRELFLVLNRSGGTSFDNTLDKLKTTVFVKAKRLFAEKLDADLSDDIVLILQIASSSYIDGVNTILFENFDDELKLKQLVEIWTDTILNGLKQSL